MSKLDKLKDAAERACFYVSPAGVWYRMLYTEDDYFQVRDEDSGEEYQYDFAELESDPHFEELVRIVIS